MVTSYLQNDHSRQLFLNRRRDILKQLLTIFLAVVLLFFDTKYHNNPIRVFVGNLSSSLQIITTRPMVWFDKLQQFVFGQHELQEQNQGLAQQVLNLQASLHQKKLQIYQYEKLKKWLDSHESMIQFANAANLLLIQVNPNRQIYILDKGRSDGVFEGQVAIDGQGIIGQIIDVGKYTSTLLLISDAKCAVPIINKRTGEHGVVIGKNKRDELQLLNMPKTNEVQAGDILMTSGLGMVYPFGIPVGVVQSVTPIPGEDFLNVDVKPLASINKHHMVILLKSFKDIQHWQKGISQRMTIVEENS